MGQLGTLHHNAFKWGSVILDCTTHGAYGTKQKAKASFNHLMRRRTETDNGTVEENSAVDEASGSEMGL